MRISLRPPPSTSIRTRVAPASSEFSSSSLTTDAGRSTTSPAAIWLATWSESMRMRPIPRLYCCQTSADYRMGTAFSASALAVLPVAAEVRLHLRVEVYVELRPSKNAQ